jgi:hypothetical protein
MQGKRFTLVRRIEAPPKNSLDRSGAGVAAKRKGLSAKKKISRRPVNSDVRCFLRFMKRLPLTLTLCFVSASFATAQSKTDATPLTYGMVLDHSGSMKDALKYINASAAAIIDSNAPGDETFITRFISTDTAPNISLNASRESVFA